MSLIKKLILRWKLGKLQRQILKAFRIHDIKTGMFLQARYNAWMDMEQGRICNCEHCLYWKEKQL